MSSQSGAAFKENNLLEDKHYHEDLCVVLKLHWTHMLPAVDNHCPWKAKCLSLQISFKLGPNFIREVILAVLDMGLHDEAEAVIFMPDSKDGISRAKLSLDINFDTSDNHQTSYKAFVRTHGVQRVQLNGHVSVVSTEGLTGITCLKMGCQIDNK
ncbi:hypothetical protein PIB30_048625 [Stylosanthes scabra]|uniref:Uncharacterized protein n=1 Tax=Stylosanthes scabra TaxID=79078 RepID=A0ABU6UII1_9FABA|nr:hypothetical protein [Stylosanthes scabra]